MLAVLALASCRRDERAPAPSASVAAAGSDFAERAREKHLQEELTRASSRWQARPSVGDCGATLKEKSDRELCQLAETALTQVTGAPASTPEATLARLAPAALALARLSERLRYLSLLELAERRVEGAAGAGHGEQREVKLDESPVSRQLEVAIRLERDVIRNLGAYLEYGPLSVRRAAFDSSKELHAQHPRWPALDRLLSEASVLESDAALKRDLQGLSASGAPPKRPADAQSAETK